MSSSSISDVSGIVGTPLTDTTANVVFGSSLIPYIDVQSSKGISGSVLADPVTTVELLYNFNTTVDDSQTVSYAGLTANAVTTIYSTASGGLTDPIILIPITTPVNGNNTLLMSDDGERWAYSRTNQLSSATSVFWNDTHWVATGSGPTGANYITSTNGINWVDVSCPFLTRVSSAAFNDDGMGVAVGTTGPGLPYTMSVLLSRQVWFPIVDSQTILNVAKYVLKTTKWIACGSKDNTGTIIESYNGLSWSNVYSSGTEVTTLDWNSTTNTHLAIGGPYLLSRDSSGVWSNITQSVTDVTSASYTITEFIDVKFNGTYWVLSAQTTTDGIILTRNGDSGPWTLASQQPNTTSSTITNLYWDGTYWNAVMSNGYISKASNDGSSWTDTLLPANIVGNGYATKLLKPNVSRPITNDVDPIGYDASLAGLTGEPGETLEQINNLALPLSPLTTVISNTAYIGNNFQFNGTTTLPTFSSNPHLTFSLNFQTDKYLTKYINFQCEDGQEFGMKLSNSSIQFTTNTAQNTIPRKFSKNGMNYAYLYRLLPIYSIETSALETLKNSVNGLIENTLVPILDITGKPVSSYPAWFDSSNNSKYNSQKLQFYSGAFDNKALYWDYNVQPIIDTYNFSGIDDSLFTNLNLQNTNYPTLAKVLSDKYDEVKNEYVERYKKECSLSNWLLTNYNSNSGITGKSLQEAIALSYNVYPDSFCLNFKGTTKTINRGSDYYFQGLLITSPTATFVLSVLKDVPIFNPVTQGVSRSEEYFRGQGVVFSVKRTDPNIQDFGHEIKRRNGYYLETTGSLNRYLLPVTSLGVGRLTIGSGVGFLGTTVMTTIFLESITKTSLTYFENDSRSEIMLDSTLRSFILATDGGNIGIDGIMQYSQNLNQMVEKLKTRAIENKLLVTTSIKEIESLDSYPATSVASRPSKDSISISTTPLLSPLPLIDDPDYWYLSRINYGISCDQSQNITTTLYDNYPDLSNIFIKTSNNLRTLESFITNESETIINTQTIRQQQLNAWNALVSNATMSVNMYNQKALTEIQNKLNSIYQTIPEDDSSILTNVSYTDQSVFNVTYDGKFLRFYVDAILIKQFIVLNNSSMSFSMNFGNLTNNILTGVSGSDWNSELMNPVKMNKDGININTVSGLIKNISLTTEILDPLMSVINTIYREKYEISINDLISSRSLGITMIPISESAVERLAYQKPFILLDYYNTLLRFTTNVELIKYCGTQMISIPQLSGSLNPYTTESINATNIFTSYITNEILAFKNLINTLIINENNAYSSYLAGLTGTIPDTSYGYSSSQNITPYFIDHTQFQATLSTLLSTVNSYSTVIDSTDIIFLLQQYRIYAPLKITYTNAIDIFITPITQTPTILNPFVLSRTTNIGRRTVELGSDGSTGDTLQSRYPAIPDRALTKSISNSLNNAFQLYSIQNIGNTGPTGTIKRISSEELTPLLSSVNTGYTGASGSVQDWFNLLNTVLYDINGLNASYTAAEIYIDSLKLFNIDSLAENVISQKTSDIEFAMKYLNNMYSTSQVSLCLKPSDTSAIDKKLAWDFYYGMGGSKVAITNNTSSPIGRYVRITYVKNYQAQSEYSTQQIVVKISQGSIFTNYSIGQKYSEYAVPNIGKITGTIVNVSYELTSTGRDVILNVVYPGGKINTSKVINYNVTYNSFQSATAAISSLIGRTQLVTIDGLGSFNGVITSGVPDLLVPPSGLNKNIPTYGLALTVTVPPSSLKITNSETLFQVINNYIEFNVGDSYNEGIISDVSVSYITSNASISLNYDNYTGLSELFDSSAITCTTGTMEGFNPNYEVDQPFINFTYVSLPIPSNKSYSLFPYKTTIQAITGATGNAIVPVLQGNKALHTLKTITKENYTSVLAPFIFTEMGHTFGMNISDIAPKLTTISYCDPEFSDAFVEYFNTNIGTNSYPAAALTNYSKYVPLNTFYNAFSLNNSYLGRMVNAKLYGGDIIFSNVQYNNALNTYINAYETYNAYEIPQFAIDSIIYNIQINLTSMLTNYFETFRLSQNQYYYFSQRTDTLYTRYIENFNNQSLSGYTGTSFNSLYTQIVDAQNAYITSQISLLPDPNVSLFTTTSSVLSAIETFKLGLSTFPAQIATVQTVANQYILNGFSSLFNTWLTSENVYANVVDSQVRFNAISASTALMPPPGVEISSGAFNNFIVNILPIDQTRWYAGLTGLTGLSGETLTAASDQRNYNRFNPVWRYFNGDIVSYNGQIYTCINTDRDTSLKNSPPEPINSIVMWSEYHDLPVSEPLISHPMRRIDGPFGDELNAIPYDPLSINSIPPKVSYSNSFYKSNASIENVQKLFGQSAATPESFINSIFWKVIGPLAGNPIRPAANGVWRLDQELNKINFPETNQVSVLTGTGIQYGYYQSFDAKNASNPYLFIQEYNEETVYEIGDIVTYNNNVYTRLANGTTVVDGEEVLIIGIDPPSEDTTYSDNVWLARPYIHLESVIINIPEWSELRTYIFGDYVIFKNMVYECITPSTYAPYNPQQLYTIGTQIVYENYIYQAQIAGSLPIPPKISLLASSTWYRSHTLEIPAGAGRPFVPASKIPKLEADYNPLDVYSVGDMVIINGFLIKFKVDINPYSAKLSMPGRLDLTIEELKDIGCQTKIAVPIYTVEHIDSQSCTITTTDITGFFELPVGTRCYFKSSEKNYYFDTTAVVSFTMNIPLDNGDPVNSSYNRFIIRPTNSILMLNVNDYPTITRQTSKNWEIITNYYSNFCTVKPISKFDNAFDYFSNTSYYNNVYRVEFDNAVWVYIRCMNLNGIPPSLPEPYTNWKFLSNSPNTLISAYDSNISYKKGDKISYKGFIFECICEHGFGYTVNEALEIVQVVNYFPDTVATAGVMQNSGNGNSLLTTVIPGNDDNDQPKWGNGAIHDPWAVVGFASNVRKSFAESVELSYYMYKHDLNVFYNAANNISPTDTIDNLVYPIYRKPPASQIFTSLGLSNTDTSLKEEITRITKTYSNLEFYFYSNVFKCMQDSLQGIQHLQGKINQLSQNWFLDNWSGVKEVWRSNLEYNPPLPIIDGNTVSTQNMDLKEFLFFNNVTLTNNYEQNLKNLFDHINNLPFPNDALNLYRSAAGCSLNGNQFHGRYLNNYNKDNRTPLSGTNFANLFEKDAINGSNVGLASFSMCTPNIEGYINQSRSLQISLSMLVSYVQDLCMYQQAAAYFTKGAITDDINFLLSHKLILKTGTDYYINIPMFTMADRNILNYNTDIPFTPPAGLTGADNPDRRTVDGVLTGNPDYWSLTEPTSGSLPLFFQFTDLVTANSNLKSFTNQQFLSEFQTVGISYPGGTIYRDSHPWATLSPADLKRYQNKVPISSACPTPNDCTPGAATTYYYKSMIAYSQLAEIYSLIPPTYCYTNVSYVNPKSLTDSTSSKTTYGHIQAYLNEKYNEQEEARKQALITGIIIAVAVAAVCLAVPPPGGQLLMGAVTAVQTIASLLPEVDGLQIATNPYQALTGQTATQAGLLQRCTVYETLLAQMAATPQQDVLTTSNQEPIADYSTIKYYTYKYAQQFLHELNTVEIPRLMKDYKYALTASPIFDILGSTSGLNFTFDFPTQPSPDDYINQPGNYGLAMARAYAATAQQIIAMYEAEILIPPYIRPPLIRRPAIVKVLSIYVPAAFLSPQDHFLYCRNPRREYAEFYSNRYSNYRGFPRSVHIIDHGEDISPPNARMFSRSEIKYIRDEITGAIKDKVDVYKYCLTNQSDYLNSTVGFGITNYTVRYINENSVIGLDGITPMPYADQARVLGVNVNLTTSSSTNDLAKLDLVGVGDLLYFDPQALGVSTPGSLSLPGVSQTARVSAPEPVAMKWEVKMNPTNRFSTQNNRLVQSGGQGTAPRSPASPRRVVGPKTSIVKPGPDPVPPPIETPPLPPKVIPSKPSLLEGLKPNLKPQAETFAGTLETKFNGRIVNVTAAKTPVPDLPTVKIFEPPSYPQPTPDPVIPTKPQPIPLKPARIVPPDPMLTIRNVKQPLTRGTGFRSLASAADDIPTPAPSKMTSGFSSKLFGPASMLIGAVVTAILIPALPNDCEGVFGGEG